MMSSSLPQPPIPSSSDSSWTLPPSYSYSITCIHFYLLPLRIILFHLLPPLGPLTLCLLFSLFRSSMTSNFVRGALAKCRYTASQQTPILLPLSIIPLLRHICGVVLRCSAKLGTYGAAVAFVIMGHPDMDWLD